MLVDIRVLVFGGVCVHKCLCACVHVCVFYGGFWVYPAFHLVFGCFSPIVKPVQ